MLSPIGLDIGTHVIKAVQYCGQSIQCALLLPRIEPAVELSIRETQRLAQVLDRRGFRGTDVVLNIPPAMLLTSFIDLPPVNSGAPLDEIARIELARAHRIEPHELEARYWAMPESPRHTGKNTHALVAGCRHQHANQLLNVIEHAGLEPRALDLSGWALARICQPLFTNERTMIAIVDVGWRNVRFMLALPDNLVYERVLGGSGIEAAVNTIQRAQSLDATTVECMLYEPGLQPPADASPATRRVAALLQNHMDAITAELELSLAYAEHQYPDAPIARIALVGGGAGIPGIAQHLSDTLGLPTLPVAPDILNPDDALFDNDPQRFALTPAAGLARIPLEQMA